MGQEPETAPGPARREKPPIYIGPEKSLKGFRKEEDVQVGKKEFVQGEALESDRSGANP
jgi:hypothetical protein